MSIYFYLVFILIPISVMSMECAKDKHLVKAHSRRAYTKADGTFVKATLVSSHCRSDRESDDFWQGKMENNRPKDWPYTNEKSKQWTVEEMERVFEAICELPQELWKKSKYKIYRMDKSKDGQNPATSTDGIVVLYDSAFNQKNRLSRVPAHEFAHEVYNSLIYADAKDYRAVTNWFLMSKNGETKFFSRKSGFVTDDGRVSPEEDFANNIEFFLFERNVLKSKTPHAHRWIMQYFDAKLSLRKCNK